MVWRKELSHVVGFNKMYDLKVLLARKDIQCGLQNLTRWDEQAGGAPLHWAALSGKFSLKSLRCCKLHLFIGRTEMLNRLLDAGARVNCYRVGPDSNPFKLTALHDAVHSGQFDAVKLLLDRGANPSMTGNWDNYKGSCVDWAKDNQDILDLLCLSIG